MATQDPSFPNISQSPLNLMAKHIGSLDWPVLKNAPAVQRYFLKQELEARVSEILKANRDLTVGDVHRLLNQPHIRLSQLSDYLRLLPYLDSFDVGTAVSATSAIVSSNRKAARELVKDASKRFASSPELLTSALVGASECVGTPEFDFHFERLQRNIGQMDVDEKLVGAMSQLAELNECEAAASLVRTAARFGDLGVNPNAAIEIAMYLESPEQLKALELISKELHGDDLRQFVQLAVANGAPYATSEVLDHVSSASDMSATLALIQSRVLRPEELGFLKDFNEYAAANPNVVAGMVDELRNAEDPAWQVASIIGVVRGRGQGAARPVAADNLDDPNGSVRSERISNGPLYLGDVLVAGSYKGFDRATQYATPPTIGRIRVKSPDVPPSDRPTEGSSRPAPTTPPSVGDRGHATQEVPQQPTRFQRRREARRDSGLTWRASIATGIARVQQTFAGVGERIRRIPEPVRRFGKGRFGKGILAGLALVAGLTSSGGSQVVAESPTPSSPQPKSTSEQRSSLVDADEGIRKGKVISSSDSQAKLETAVSGLVAKKMAGELGVTANNVAWVKRAIESGNFKAASERIESLGSLEPGDASAVAYSLGKLQRAFYQGSREDAHKSVWAAGLVGDEFKEVVKNYADRTFDGKTGPKDWESAKKSLETLRDFGL